MSRWSRINDMPRRTKQLWAAALAVVAVVGIVLATRVGPEGEDDPRGQPRVVAPDGMEGMDMPGMGSSGGSVRITAEQIRSFGITFATVEQRLLEDEIRAVGIVALNETRQATVAPKFGGYAERLYVDFTGQPVRRGQPMAEVYSPDLVAAQEELLLAARLRGSLGGGTVPGVAGGGSDLVAAARQRLRLWDIADEQIDGILSSGRARRTLTLYAPVAGIVTEKLVVLGQSFEAGDALYQIADLSVVWVEVDVREADAALVQPGDAATIEFAAMPGLPISGLVEYVYPTLQAEARTLKARITVPNPNGRLKPGMYGTVRLRAASRTALTVPASAVLRTGERQLVFVDLGNGEIMPQPVEIARISGEYAEVLAGVEPGQRVVTSAQYLLDSESNLAEVMRSMIGSMNMSDMGSPEMGGMDMGGADMKGMKMPPPRD